MQKMVENSPLADTVTKKITNHSARKTLVKKLKSNQVAKSDIIGITGHNSEAGLDAYASGDEAQQEAISHAIDNVNVPPRIESASTSTHAISKEDPRILNPCLKLFPHWDINKLFSINDNATTMLKAVPFFQQQQPQQQQAQNVENHFHFHNCTDLKINTFPQQTHGYVSSPPTKKRRRLVIYDVSDSSQEQ